MSTSPRDSNTASLSDTNSNKDLTAETAQETVMAEQVSHNVVNYSESTGDALVDVAANQTTVPSADYGTTPEYFPETKNILETSQAANEYAIPANNFTSSMQPEIQAISEAEPSAGEAVGIVTGADIVPDSTALDNSGADYVQFVNGIHDTTSPGDGPADDGSMREGSVDVSVNSDTEGSRGDASDLKKDEKHHVRTNSVKKPTTFSKVSVTKNFLAKSATTAPPVVKPGDKPSPAGTPPQPSAAKPRLIAKTGTTLRDVQRPRLGSETSSGPDASKVWNKNRPVPPPPPKQFTDEELKQQYGIHLATRLQTDENGKESKWADIDDDEEDWAPDTVVWMDGTKSTLTPNETAALVQKEQKPASPQPAKLGEGVKPTLAMKRPTELGPTKTILKPGASAAAAQARQNDSGAATPIDKSSLTDKSPAAVPVKSPWAALPPVDKVSPINPPVHQRQPPLPFSSQDARAYELPLPPPPAREIAADTFDRSWREGEGGTRELFNSANGRYEPVQEGGRRGSIKPDSAYRKPSVLQRPSPNAPAPAEPSPAFQTRSTTQMDGPWARRRGSSVSQGSIPSARRMSVSKTSEMSPAPERRTSTVIGHDMRTSPKMPRNEPVQPPMFSQQSAWQQQMPPRPESGDAEEEDPVKVQERVMREKRELAKKRRQEEEERLEAEKRERLQARLAQLEGAGKSRKEREAEATAAAAVVQTPASELAPESAPTTPTVDETQAQLAEMSSKAAPALEAQPLPTGPETLLPKQPASEEILPSPIPSRDQLAGLPERPISSTDQSQREQLRPPLSPRANARAPFQQPGAPYKPSASSYSSPGDRKQQPSFGRSPLPNNDTFTPWPTTAPNGNVWSTSGIGNGTFESANVFAPMPTSQQSSALPPPPGMTRPPGSTRISPQSLGSESRSPNLKQQSVAEPPRGFGPPGFEGRSDAFASQGRVNGPSPAPGLGRQTHLPGPIAPPSRAQQQQQQQAAQRQDPLAAWNSAAHRLPYQYKSDAEAAENRPKEPVTSAPRDDTFKETFRQTSADPGKLGAPRRYDKTEYTIHDVQGSRSVQSLSPVPPNAQTQPSGPFSTASPTPQDLRKMTGENNVRIPDPSTNPAHGGLPTQLPPIGPPGSQQPTVSVSQSNANVPLSAIPPVPEDKEPSPPPPETLSHPVNSGDASHPLVRLPPEKPKVKLPPTSAPIPPPMAPHTSVVLPQRPISNNWGPPGSARPIVMQEAWQARFNGLFNRTPIQTETPPSPPKTPPKMQGPALAVTSSSRAVMDETPVATSATVSLPQVKKITSSEGFTIDDSEDVVSKPTIEQMFNEELSFGSLPKITIPKNAIYDTMFEPDNMLKKADPTPTILKAVEAQSEPEFNLWDVHPKRRDGYYIHLPGLKLFRKLARYNNGSRKPSAGTNQERKPSGRFKGKGKESIPSSSATNATQGPESRKQSFQKGQTSAPESPAPSSGPATETSRKMSWAKPPKGRGRGPPPVKAA